MGIKRIKSNARLFVDEATAGGSVVEDIINFIQDSTDKIKNAAKYIKLKNSFAKYEENLNTNDSLQLPNLNEETLKQLKTTGILNSPELGKIKKSINYEVLAVENMEGPITKVFSKNAQLTDYTITYEFFDDKKNYHRISFGHYLNQDLGQYDQLFTESGNHFVLDSKGNFNTMDLDFTNKQSFSKIHSTFETLMADYQKSQESEIDESSM